MKIKVMGYNILHGFHTFKSQPYVLQKERLKAAQEVVKKENPDILGITEACFGVPNPMNILMDYKKLFNFKFATYCAAGPEWGCTLLSNYPILEAYPFSTQTGGMGIRSQIIIKKKTVNIDLIHPRYDIVEDEKIRFVKNFLENLRKPYIIFGDFNAYSDEDDYDRDLVVKTFKSFNPESGEKTADIWLDRRLTPYLRSKNLLDSFKDNKDYTIPTPNYKMGPSSARIDYIFHTPEIKVINAKVIKNKQTEIASDHYPIVAELEIK